MIQTYIRKRQSDFAISQRLYIHETSHTYAKFRENKALEGKNTNKYYSTK